MLLSDVSCQLLTVPKPMRHLQSTIKLNRNLGSRQALIRNLLVQLYKHDSITTTQSKAKIIKPLADRLIYKAKDASIHTKRLLNAQLNHPEIVKHLTHQISSRYPNRQSGFTKIIKLGHRIGDNTMMVKISLLPSDVPSAETDKKILTSTPKTTSTPTKSPAKTTATKSSKTKKLSPSKPNKSNSPKKLKTKN